MQNAFPSLLEGKHNANADRIHITVDATPAAFPIVAAGVRAAIVRALANDPPLIVADEPTGNLDQETAHRIFDLFQQFVAGGKTMVVVTHDKDLAQTVPRKIEIADGQIVADHT